VYLLGAYHGLPPRQPHPHSYRRRWRGSAFTRATGGCYRGKDVRNCRQHPDGDSVTADGGRDRASPSWRADSGVLSNVEPLRSLLRAGCLPGPFCFCVFVARVAGLAQLPDLKPSATARMYESGATVAHGDDLSGRADDDHLYFRARGLIVRVADSSRLLAREPRSRRAGPAVSAVIVLHLVAAVYRPVCHVHVRWQVWRFCTASQMDGLTSRAADCGAPAG